MHCRTASLLLLSSLSTLSAAASLEAQQADTAELSPVVVTATKTPTSRENLNHSVSVISGEELQDRGLTRVVDALREIPGISITQAGSTGAVATLFVRGGESRYTKVLVDGVAVNASGGFIDLSHLTTSNIDRIEVLRGPGSVVHGADAVTAVVHILTRRGGAAPRLDADVRGGSRRTLQGTLDFAGTLGGLDYSLGGAQHSTRGVYDFNNQYSNGTLSGALGRRFGPADVRFTARYTAAEFHYPTDYTGAPVDSNAYRVQHRLTLAARGAAQLAPTISASILLGSNDVTDVTEDLTSAISQFDEVRSEFRSLGYRRSAEARVELGSTESSRISVGAEFTRQRENSTSSEGRPGQGLTPISSFIAARSNRAAYAELLSPQASRLAYEAAVRVDDSEDHGSFSTHRFAMGYAIGAQTRIRGSYGTAFNPPAFSQLRPTLFTIGNPELEPERTRTWEAAFERNAPARDIVFTAVYFNQRFEDLIQYVPAGPPSFRGSYANLAAAEANGWEVELRTDSRKPVSVNLSHTHVRPRITRLSPDYSGDLRVGDQLLRRPRNTSRLVLHTREADRNTEASLSLMRVGDRPDLDFREFPARLVTLGAYTRADVTVNRTLIRSETREVSLTFRAENALDTEFEDVFRFRTPGRVLLLGVRYSGGM